MSKLKYKTFDSSVIRAEIKQHYLNRYFSLFMANYKWRGLDEQQEDYLMRRCWSDGRVAASVLKAGGEVVKTDDAPNGLLILTKYAEIEWNIYDYPTKIQLINNRGSNLIPTSLQVVNKDAVIGYAQLNKKSVLECIEPKIEEIVDIEMTIRTNRKLHKMPFVIGCTPESKTKMKDIFDNVMNDDLSVVMDLEDVKNFTALQTGTPYIIDKLEAYLGKVDAEILTILGVDNLGIAEKHEQLRVDEINSNNDIINDHNGVYLTAMERFAEDVRNVLGIDISVETTSKPVTATKDETKEEGDDYEND